MAFDEGVYVHYIGNVGSDPTDTDRNGKQLVTMTGKEFTTFRLGVRSGPKKDDPTNWYDVPVFDNEWHPALRDAVKANIHRGSRVAIAGEETSRTVGDKTYLTLWPRQIYLLQGVEDTESAPEPVAAAEEF